MNAHHLRHKKLGGTSRKKMQVPEVTLLHQAVQAVNAGQWAVAERLGALLLQALPQEAGAWMVKAMVERQQGRYPQAIEAAQRAEQLGYQPRLAVLNLLGRLLLESGNVAAAWRWLQEACQLPGAPAEAFFSTGAACFLLQRFVEAEQAFSRTLEMEPQHVEAQLSRAVLWRQTGHVRKSLRALEALAQAVPGQRRIENEWAKSAGAAGDFATAESVWAAMLARDPEDAEALSGRIFDWNYVEEAAEQRFARTCALMQDYEKRMRQRWAVPQAPRPVDPEPEVLDVGLVSGDFGQHPVGYFLQGFWAHVDRRQLRLHVFSTFARNDVLRDQLKAQACTWTEVDRLNTAALAALIRERGIHLLVDLSGHTRNNRLDVFALHPAPVQVSWLGYFATTGLPAMDFIWVDKAVCPVDQPQCFSEQRVYLEPSYRCFNPLETDWAVAPAPCLHSEWVTLGCFNNLSKLNEGVVSLWAELLHELPVCRLFLKSSQLAQPEEQEWMRQRFKGYGISGERLLLEGSESYSAYMNAYARVDLALDPFPYTGATVSLEGIWMGVPLVTLAGSDLLGRSGVNILTNIGLDCLIAENKADYKRLVGEWVQHPERLAALRHGLRQRVQASVLMDGAGFAHRWMQACRDLWRRQSAGPRGAEG